MRARVAKGFRTRTLRALLVPAVLLGAGALVGVTHAGGSPSSSGRLQLRTVRGAFPRPRWLQGVVTGSISEGGSPVTLTIANAGDTGQLTFSGTTGDRVSLSITNVSIPSSWVSIQNPDGSTLVSQTAVFTTGAFVDTVTLPQTGTYSILVSPWSNGTGSITFQLYSVAADLSGQVTPTAAGVAIQSSFTSPGQNGVYTFSGSQGQRIAVDLHPVSLSGTFGNYELVSLKKPDGSVLTQSGAVGSSGGFMDTVSLPVSGTYTLLVDPQGDAIGSATETVYSVPADVGSPALTIGGASGSASIGNVGQNAELPFFGSAGQPLTLSWSNNTISSSGVIFRILDSGANVVASSGLTCACTGSFTTTLPADGSYSVQVDPYQTSLGGVTVALTQTNAFEPLGQTYGPCDGGLDALNQSGCWGDVNTLLGAFTTQARDASMPDIGIGFNYTRSYTSANTNTGRLGPGWTDSYSAVIRFQPNGDALVQDENGQQIYFAKQADGTFVAPPGGVASLTAAGGGYQLLNADQTKLGFDSNGRLSSIKDRNGEGVTLAYDGGGNLSSVTDSVGRVVTFTPNADGTLQKLTLPDSRSVSYGYTGGRLTSVTDLRGGTTTYGYDANGLLATVLDQNLHTLVTNHYTSGRIDSQTDALGKQTTFAWDVPSQTETITDANSHVWQDVYSSNMLVKTVDPRADTTQYGYDAADNLASVQDPNLHTTSMTYDGRHNMLTRTAPAPLSYQESWTYDSMNDVLTHQDGRGQTTSYGYDTAGNLTSQTLPDPDGAGPLAAPVIQYGRDPAGTGLLVSQTDPNNRTTHYGYDSQGNLTSTTSPLSELTTTGYDTVGRMTSRVDGRGNVSGCGCAAAHTTSFGYDNADHLTSETDPGLPAKSWLYDPAGNLQKVTDQNGHHTDYSYDADERLSSVTAPDTTSVTSYSYDNVGKLHTRTDPNSHVTTYGYDNANRLTTVTLPTITTPSNLTPVWTYGYDAAGNQTTVLDPNGATTTTTYDQLNRPTQVSYTGGATTPTATTSYDADSNRTQLIDGDGTVTYSYDYDNRLTSASRVHTAGGTDTFSYGYDPAGNITSRTYPDGTVVSYAPNNDERLASVTVGSSTTSYGYDPAGNLTTTTLPSGNGYVETRVYDNANRLTEVKNAKGASVLSDFVQSLDNVGNPLTIARTGATTSTTLYGYDSRDRLTSVCFQAACPNSFDPKIGWTYDSVGNRLTETRASTSATSSYNEGDQLTQVVTSSSNPYPAQVDADGAQPYWRLGETTGSSFASSIGSYTGSWTGSPTLGVTGALNSDTNKAVTLNGSSQYGTVTSASQLGKTNNFSIELWIKRSKNAASQAVLGKPLTTTTKSENYAIWLDTSNKVRFEVGNGTNSQTVTSAAAVDTNWHHIVATFASGSLKLYLDGSLSASATASFSTTATNSSTLDVGRAGSSNYYGGSLDEIAIYGSVLTATQIADHHTKGTSTPPGPQTVTYSYDHNGNETAAGTRTFSYDAANRLASTTKSGTTDNYVYDGNGNRLSDTAGSSTTKYLWDSNNSMPELALERDGNNNLLRRYSYGNGIGPISMTTPAGSFYYHYDTLRNVANLTDASGVTEWSYSYEPYGTATAVPNGSPPANPMQYNGQYLDATGLYNLRAREYDPTTGRFNGLDPTPPGPTSPYEASYDYAGQDPINNYDLDGKKVCAHLGPLSGLCGAVANGSRATANTIKSGLEAYGRGSLSVSGCVYYCAGVVGYHGRLYLQTGERGALGGGLMWSHQGPYASSDNISGCVGACIGRSVENGTGATSYSFGLGTVGVQAGHAKTKAFFKLPWSNYP
jgi:RHS repeat-associated protein